LQKPFDKEYEAILQNIPYYEKIPDTVKNFLQIPHQFHLTVSNLPMTHIFSQAT